MSRVLIKVTCLKCDRPFPCYSGSISSHEQICNECQGLRNVRGWQNVTLGWPE